MLVDAQDNSKDYSIYLTFYKIQKVIKKEKVVK